MTKQELKENLYTSLQELGLSEAQCDLYITSLSLGPTTIAKLAKALSMARPNVYKVIEELESHGLAKFSQRKKFSHTFVVEPPTVLLEKIHQKREKVSQLGHTLRSAMPDMLALYSQGDRPTQIRVLEGQEQYLRLHHTILDETKDVMHFFGSAADFITFTSWDEERRFIKSRLRRGIRINALVLPSDDAETLRSTDAKELRETRILHDIAPFVTSFQLFANKVILWQPKTPIAVLIEDEYFVVMLKSIFDRLWQNAGTKKEMPNVPTEATENVD